MEPKEKRELCMQPLQRKMRTSTETQLFQYSLCIQLAVEEVELIAKTPELWQWRI